MPAIGDTLYRRGGDAARIAPDAGSDPHRAGVLVIGGGVTGLSAAWHLARAGRQVTLIEGGVLGDTTASLSAGMLSLDVEVDFDDFDPDAGAALFALSRAGIDGILELVERERIDCDLQRGRGSIYLSTDPRCRAFFAAELARRRRLGIEGTEILEGEAVQSILRSPRHRVALFERDAHSLDPRSFCRGLAQLLLRRGVRLFERSPVAALDLRARRAHTRQGATVDFDDLVLCSGLSPLTRRCVPDAVRRVLPVWSTLLATPPLPPRTLARLFPSGRQPLWWDNRRFYNYGRTTSDGRILFGGADLVQSTRQALAAGGSAASASERLAAEFAAFLPELAGCDAEFCWGGTIAASIDEFPLIGPFAPHAHAALCATGLNLAFAGGELVAGLVAGAPVPARVWPFVALHRRQRLRHRLLRFGVGLSPVRWAINRWHRQSFKT
jgi:gamma-glutamylputrescine oxidase